MIRKEGRAPGSLSAFKGPRERAAAVAGKQAGKKISRQSAPVLPP
ncbi:hypothetical protein [Nocardia sp. SSK8]